MNMLPYSVDSVEICYCNDSAGVPPSTAEAIVEDKAFSLRKAFLSDRGILLCKRPPMKQPFELMQVDAQTIPPTEAQSASDFYDLGVEAQKTGQIQAAIQAYQTAIGLESTFDVAYINLGLAFIQLGQFDNAQQTFQQVLTLPDRTERPASIHTLAHYNLAIILNRQGHLNEAITEVQQALEITPDFEKAQQLLQQLQDSSARLTHFFL